MKQKIYLPTELSTQKLGHKLALVLHAPLVLTFSGEIGAGKTTLIRALFHSLGVTGSVKSPTFSLVESYQVGELNIHHFDLYRIQDEEELEFIGFRDYFGDNALCCIEWPQRVSLTGVDLAFDLIINGAGRDLQISAFTPAGIKILHLLQVSHE